MRGSSVDTLPLSIAQVREISGFDRLERESDSDEPVADTYTPEGPCREAADQVVAFGDDWTVFRSVADGGDLYADRQLSPMVVVAQNVVGYPSEASAGEVFDRRLKDVRECAALDLPGLGGDVERLDDNTVRWSADGMTTVYAIESDVLVDASVVALPDADRIASEVVAAVLDRIP